MSQHAAPNPRSIAHLPPQPASLLRSVDLPPRTVDAKGADPRSLLAREWLLPDGLGGFSMGTALGACTRKYHSLYTAATAPPVGRVNVLANLVVTLVFPQNGGPERRVDLSAFRFGDRLIHPGGAAHLLRFEMLDPLAEGAAAARWTFEGAGWRMTREVRSLWRSGGVVITHRVESAEHLRIELRPLLAMRDMHAVAREREGFSAREIDGVEHAAPHASAIEVRGDGRRATLACTRAIFHHAPDWWRNFRYDKDAERRYPADEDLYCPGAFVFQAHPGHAHEVALAARLDTSSADLLRLAAQPDARAAHLAPIAAALAASAGVEHPTPSLVTLAQATDDFVVTRHVAGKDRATVIAGYPWFADWGRDTMIALPGLLLATGRRDEAISVLEAFAGHLRRGLIPNCFDDRTGEPRYNAADASFWFLRAVCHTADHDFGKAPPVPPALLDACMEIAHHISGGADFGIGVDPADGLVFAGDATTQLTWMDAKADGRPATPRYGKAVEINALWADALWRLGDHLPANAAAELRSMSRRAQQSLREKFWRPHLNCLCDCLRPDVPGVGARANAWTPVDEVRPNMLVAAALAESGLTPEQRRGVAHAARDHLLTHAGIRTLAPGSPGYAPRYEGPMNDRDRGYHNGTAWPWLIGFYIEAWLQAGGFDRSSRDDARAALAPLLRRVFHEQCLGSVAEVYDADEPQRPDGCPAQAWSVAELIRAASMA